MRIRKLRSGATIAGAGLGPLFDGLARARATDPDSSHRAAQHAKDNGTISRQALETLEALRSYGAAASSKELAAGDVGRRYIYARRLPELEAAGLVRRIETKGRDTKWRLTDTRQTTALTEEGTHVRRPG